MAWFRKFLHKKTPQGLVEVSDRVFVLPCCFAPNTVEYDKHKVLIQDIVVNLQMHLPDASFMVFNFQEGEKEGQIGNLLSDNNITVMNYPQQYKSCPILPMGMIHNFLNSAENWLSLGKYNVLLVHCECGGCPVMTFMLATLLIYRNQDIGEQKTLEMIYTLVPHDFFRLVTPLNPQPSQLRYLQYISQKDEVPLNRALTLDSVILRSIANYNSEGSFRPILRINGLDPKLLFSTTKRSILVSQDKQDNCETLKIDIHCQIQGDVMMECIDLDNDFEHEVMIFRVMFNTAFIRSNHLFFNYDEMDFPWETKYKFPMDFRMEVLLSEICTESSITTTHLSPTEENEGLCDEKSVEDQGNVSNVDCQEPKAELKLNNTIADSSCDVNSLSNTFDIGQNSIQYPTQAHILSQRIFQKSIPHASSHSNILQAPQVPFQRYHKVSSAIGITALLHDHVDSQSKEITHQVNISLPSGASNPVLRPSNLQPGIISILPPINPNLVERPYNKLSPDVSTISSTHQPPIPLLPSPVFRKCQPVSKSQSSSSSPKHPITGVQNKGLPSTVPPSPPLPPPPQPLSFLPSSSSLSKTFLNPPSVILSSSGLSILQNDLETAPFPIHQETVSAQPLSSLSCPPPPPPPPPFSAGSSSSSPIKRLSYDVSDNIPSPVTLTAFVTTGKCSPLPPYPPPPPVASTRRVPTAPLHAPTGIALLTTFSVSPEAVACLPLPPPPCNFSESIPEPAPITSLSLASILPICSSPKESSSNGCLHVQPVPPLSNPSSNRMLKVGVPSESAGENRYVPPVPVPPLGAKGRLQLRSGARNQTHPRRNLKPYHWLKLTRAMQGSLWAEAQKFDEFYKAPEFDLSELESLFSASIPNSDLGNTGRKFSLRASGANCDKIHLIDLRRAYNCEIMLTKVKLPLSELLSSILALDDSTLDADQVDNLIKFCPTKEEIELLQNYSGNRQKLGKCEQFFFELMKVQRVESKLRVFSFKIQFDTQVSDLRKSLNIINSTTEEIRNSVKLKRIMHTILSLGNALNHGTARGSAVGFRLDSLLKLTDTRAINKKMTLMHYLCKFLSEKLPDLLDFPKDLMSLESSTKIQLKYLAEEMQSINKGLEKVAQVLVASANDGPISNNFCKGRNVDALAVYFGEDPSRIQFEQVVSTLLNFVRMFISAHEENLKQLELEEKKMKKMRDEKAEFDKINTILS
ncbi:formin-like protein 18 isoform X2 [Impatiens glandulifera]|uniref:formin-like protein 18 isoform X2 n=1 Tax=Impatiens glandulifera TaxID=253017 RepID=UPI001FB0C860|nr:formin-like protein 18 isoform X2 [Impatiens glandulifera]